MPALDTLAKQIELNLESAALRNVRPDRFPSPGRVDRDGVLEPPKEGHPPEHEEQDDRDQDRHDKPDYKPELVCRTYAGDLGARPLAPNIVFWESPDIWVIAPDGTDIPIAGQVNQVKVHVWNMGLATAYGAEVQLFWCNPSVGVNIASATQIGATQFLNPPLNAGENRILTFDWVPQFVNNGHECLVAQVYDPIADNLVAPFNPVQDRRVAQHNIVQIRVPAGQQIKVSFSAANLSPIMAQSALQLEPVQGAALQSLTQVLGRTALAAMNPAQARIAHVQTREARPTIALEEYPAAAVFREALEPAPQRLVRRMLNETLAALPAQTEPRHEYADEAASELYTPTRFEENAVERAPMVSSHAAELLPGHEMVFTLALAAPARAIQGTSFAYRVIEQAEGRISGGITYIVHVA